VVNNGRGLQPAGEELELRNLRRAGQALSIDILSGDNRHLCQPPRHVHAGYDTIIVRHSDEAAKIWWWCPMVNPIPVPLLAAFPAQHFSVTLDVPSGSQIIVVPLDLDQCPLQVS
jgi:hypothetical protein